MTTDYFTCNLKKNKEVLRFSGTPFSFLKQNLDSLILFLVIGVLFTVYVCLTPLFQDDFLYKFYNNDQLTHFYSKIPLISAYTDNFTNVSRFVPHLINGIFQKTGKDLFNIFTGIAFLLYGVVTALLSVKDPSRVLPVALISCGLLFLLTRGFYYVAVWMSGAPNYLYVAIIVSLFILILRRGKALIENKNGNILLLFVFGLITGWTNEGFIVGLTGASIIYYGILKRRELNASRKSLIAGLFLGCLFLCMSPYNVYKFFGTHSARYSSFNEFWPELTDSFCAFCDSLIIIILLSVLTFTCLFFYLTENKSKSLFFLKEWCKENLFIIFTFLFSCCFIVLTLYKLERSWYPSEFYATILLLTLICKLPCNLLRMVSSVTGIVTVITFLYLLPMAKQNFEAYIDMEKQIKGDLPIVVTRHMPITEFRARYMRSPQKLVYPFRNITVGDVNKYYKNTSNSFIIDEEIYKILRDKKKPWQLFHRKEWAASYVKIPENKEVESVKVIIDHKDLTLSNGQLIDGKSVKKGWKKSMAFEMEGEKWLIIPDNKFFSNLPFKIELKVIGETGNTMNSERTNEFIPTEQEVR